MVSVIRVTIRLFAPTKQIAKELIEILDKAVANRPNCYFEVYATTEVKRR